MRINHSGKIKGGKKQVFLENDLIFIRRNFRKTIAEEEKAITHHLLLLKINMT